MKMYSIVAMGKGNVIGKDGGIPWYIPNDFKYVKDVTMGHTLVMGRKCFESIGRALPGRRTIILTRNTDFTSVGCEIAHSVDEVLGLCSEDEEVYIFGGQEVYKLFMPYADKLYVTEIAQEFDGDTFFPEIDRGDWVVTSFDQGVRDEKNPYDYCFKVYDRVKKEERWWVK